MEPAHRSSFAALKRTALDMSTLVDSLAAARHQQSVDLSELALPKETILAAHASTELALKAVHLARELLIRAIRESGL